MQNRYRWFVAGTMMGMLGAYMGQAMTKPSQNKAMKKTRQKAASMAGKMSREAGTMLGMRGEALADRLR